MVLLVHNMHPMAMRVGSHTARAPANPRRPASSLWKEGLEGTEEAMLMTLDDMVSWTKRVTAVRLLERPAAWGRADTGGGGGATRLLVLNTKIADPAGNKALGLLDCAGEGTPWAGPSEKFCSVPLLDPDGGAEEVEL